MKAVLRWGVLTLGVALAGQAAQAQEATAGAKPPAASAKAGGGASKAPGAKPKKASRKGAAAKKAEPAAKPIDEGDPWNAGGERTGRRNGPARVSPPGFETPRFKNQDDAQREAFADKKRDEAIEGLKRLVAKLPDGSPEQAAMLYRLSELYWEKSKYLYRKEMERAQAAEKAADAAAARGEKVAQPERDHRESERFRGETMAIYDRLLRDFPRYDRRDEILFSLGYNLQELDKRDAAVARYQQLIAEFPQSEFVPQTYIQLGNHYFDVAQLPKAREAFEKARDSKVPAVWAYAVYKLAWCDFNVGELEAGLKKLYEVVDFAQAQGGALTELRTEALNDTVVFYKELNRPDEGLAYYRKHGGKRQQRLTARLAGALAEGGHYDSALKLYRVLIDDEPMGARAPEFQQAIVKAHEQLRQRDKVRAEMRKMVALYGPQSDWWKANAQNKGITKEAFEVTEMAMREMVTEYHQEAQKTKQVETYRLARDIYKQYVDAFASNADPAWVSDHAFNLRFYYAEILWALEEWEPAAAQYDAVVAFQIPDRESAREVSQEKYRKTAAYSAILAYDKLVKIEKGELARSQLKDGQKVDEGKSKGGVEKGSKLVKKDAGQQEQPLTRFEERLVAACDVYIDKFPNEKDEIDLRYQAAVILYDRNHFVDAARRFGAIIEKFPTERRSRDAADLTMYVLERREEWFDLSQLAAKFLENKRLVGGDAEFARRVGTVVEGSRYKWIDEVVYKKEKDAAKASDEFIKFVADFPKSENADRALTYVMVIAQEANQLDRAAAAGERILKEYPRSNFELKTRYTLGQLYEKLAEFKRAAQMYESFVAAYDAAERSDKAAGEKAAGKKAGDGEAEQKRAQKLAERRALLKEASAWVPDAIFNAGLWWEGVGESHRAVAAYTQYLTRFKDRKDAPDIAFNIALVHEKDGKAAEAARAFEAFTTTYARDGRAKAAQHFLARYHQLQAFKKLNRKADLEQVQGELVRGFARLPADAKKDPEVLDAFGHARFLALEPMWKAFTDIRFKSVSTVRRDLGNKQREMAKLEKAYLEVLNTGSGEWGIAALARIGLAYSDFARNITDSPTPPGLDEDQQGMYRAQLQELAMPLETKATEALEKALEKAYELGIYSEFTLAAQDEMNRFTPGAYASRREVPFHGSEFFATADVLRDEETASAAVAPPEPAAAPADGAAPVPAAAPSVPAAEEKPAEAAQDGKKPTASLEGVQP